MSDDIINKYNEYLSESASTLDIPESLHKKAIKSYEAVGQYLNETVYTGAKNGVSIYPQGSFELGTVTKPLKGTKESEYDIDLVCEISIPKEETSPDYVKNSIGDQLKKNTTYKTLLDEEKKRCWTLEYAEDENISFHLDILPSIPEDSDTIQDLISFTEYPDLVYSSIAITHKEGSSYSWSESNPRGYSDWFKRINKPLSSIKRQQLFESNKDVFASIEDVPDYLVKTPLQQAIQIMKRHRDIRFSGHSNEEYKPISMIITTLAAELYNNEDNVFLALRNIAAQLSGYSPLVEMRIPESKSGIIKRMGEETWYIGNPVNMKENFADRWHEDNHARARAFFEWTNWVKEDLIDVTAIPDINSIIGIVSEKLIEDKNTGRSQVTSATTSRPNIEIKPLKPWYNK